MPAVEDLVADVMWPVYPTVTVQSGVVECSGPPTEYSLRSKRRELARAFIALAGGGPGDVATFVARWGPPREVAFRTHAELKAAGEARSGIYPTAVVIDVDDALTEARWSKVLREHALDGTDAHRRLIAEDSVVAMVQTCGLSFAPGSLVPQLRPADLVVLTSIVLLEELRGVGSVLQCMNYPSPGCTRDVPPRTDGSLGGRRRLYCSPECAERARARRKYARRRAAKESTA